MINVTFSKLASSHLLHRLDLHVKVVSIVNRGKESTLIMKKRLLLTVTAGLLVSLRVYQRRFYMGLPVKVKAFS